MTIHRIHPYPESKIHVLPTAGKLDELKALMNFFSLFHSFHFFIIQRELHEQSMLCRVHRALGLVCADLQPRHNPLKVLFQGFIQGNSLGNTTMG